MSRQFSFANPTLKIGGGKTPRRVHWSLVLIALAALVALAALFTPPPAAAQTLPKVGLTKSGFGYVPENSAITFVLERSQPVTNALTVQVRVTETGNMLPATLPTTATFNAGQHMTNVRIDLPGDTTEEPHSRITLTIQDSANYEFGLPPTDAESVNETLPRWAYATAYDDDGPPDLPEGIGFMKEGMHDNEITMVWDSPPRNTGGSAITGYDVRHIASDASDRSDSNWTMVSVGPTARKVTVTGLSNTETYNFQIRAVNTQGPGRWASPSRVVSPGSIVGFTGLSDEVLPAKESNVISLGLSNTGKAATVRMSFTETGNMLRNPPTSLEVGTNFTSRQIRLQDDFVDEPDSQVTVTILPGSGYIVGAWSTMTFTILDDDVPPGAPYEPSATPGDGEVAVAWLPAPLAFRGSEPVSGYGVSHIRSDATDKSDANWTETRSTESPLVVTGLSNDVQYDFRVRGGSAVGDGEWSETVSATPRATASAQQSTITIAGPTAPVTEGDALLFTLTRTAPITDALTVLVRVRETGKMMPVHEPSTRNAVFSAGSDTTTLRVGTADDGNDEPHSYISVLLLDTPDYHVGTSGIIFGIAQDDDGTMGGGGPTGGSGPGATTGDSKPGAPTSVNATAGDGRVTVSWAAPTDTGSSAITRYFIRYIASDATDKRNKRWKKVKGATSPHMITGLTNGKQYDFAIRAINGAGPGPWTTTFTATPRP